jgi:PGF-pre-PGF domain-containing protein
MSRKKSQPLPLHRSHRIIIPLALLILLAVGMGWNYSHVEAIGGVTSAQFLQPFPEKAYYVGSSIPIDLEIRTDSRNSTGYIFVARNRAPNTEIDSPDLIYSQSYRAGYFRVKTQFTPTEAGKYYIIGYIADDKSNYYYTDPLIIVVAEPNTPINTEPTSTDIVALPNENPPANSCGGSLPGGPGGAIPETGGEKEFITCNTPANTLITIPFHYTAIHGIEKLEVISPRTTIQNAIILDQHNHSRQIPPGTVYKYTELSHTNPWNHEKIQLAITFQVDRIWLLSHQFTPRNISMYRFYNGKWEPIDTKIIQLQSGVIRYVARTDSLYPFAIVGNASIRADYETRFRVAGT